MFWSTCMSALSMVGAGCGCLHSGLGLEIGSGVVVVGRFWPLFTWLLRWGTLGPLRSGSLAVWGVGCWPIMVLYKLAARTGMWSSTVKFLPVSVNSFLVIVRAPCRCSKIFALKASCVSVCPEFPCGLLWVRLCKVGVVRGLSNTSELGLTCSCSLTSPSTVSEPVRVWHRAPASFSLGGNRSGGLGGRHWEGCWAGLVWVHLYRWFSRALCYFTNCLVVWVRLPWL